MAVYDSSGRELDVEVRIGQQWHKVDTMGELDTERLWFKLEYGQVVNTDNVNMVRVGFKMGDDTGSASISYLRDAQR